MAVEKYLPSWLRGCSLFNLARLDADSDTLDPESDPIHKFRVDSLEAANVIGSKNHGMDIHKVFIDLDVEHYYVPSSTYGHAHLYVNVDLKPDELEELMHVLAKYGIVQKGWANQIRNPDRRQNTFRLPWIKKEA